VLLAAMASSFDPDEVWRRVAWAERGAGGRQSLVGAEP